jgi:nitrogen fixation/metabolism regulation signal transduction histidine kinase
MPKEQKKEIVVEIPEKARLSLEKAFQLFQRQSEMLEKSHCELQNKLNEAQLNLEEKNRELAAKIKETESVREKLSRILESINDAVFLLLPGNIIDTANGAASELYARYKEKGRELFAFPELAILLESEKCVKDKNIEIAIAGDKKAYMVTIVRMPAETEGLGERKVLALKDVTAYRELQRRVSREDRMAALGKVAASVAHEIRNPLSAIEGFAVLLERDLRNEPASQRLAVKTIYAARQLNSVVNNLLSYTREIRPVKMLCDLNSQISEAMDFVIPMAEDRKVDLKLELCSSPLTADVDHVQIKQVITNITINAVEACPRGGGGWTVIRTGTENSYAVIEVIDNGRGIADKRKKRIFEPFFTMKDGGIGLGLSLSQRIVESHEGIIFECGSFGKGARFVIKLKLAEVGR